MAHKKIKKQLSKKLDVDDVLLDSFNLPEFATESFEGRLTKDINKLGALIFGAVILIVFVWYFTKALQLQVFEFDRYKSLALQNISKRVTIIPKRGVVQDRYGKILAGNGEVLPELSNLQKDIPVYKRVYTNLNGLAHVIGYVKYPQKDNKGQYWRDNYIGVGGVEQMFDKLLAGTPGWKLSLKDAIGSEVSGYQIKEAKDGKNVQLSLDAELSDALYKAIQYGAIQEDFKGGAGVIMDIQTGEVLALVSYPEFSLNAFTEQDSNYITKELNDKRKPLLQRATLGEYAPGSIVKPGVAIAALYENIITPEKKILSTGSLKVENENVPGTYSFFNDWKAHGLVNMKEAIAHSSDVYFYEIGGGYKEQKGLGIEKIKRYARLFGFGEKTGIEQPAESKGLVPDPKWKMDKFGERWYLGNTYHTAIGQYGYLVTPVQAVRYIASIANYGKLFNPTIVKGKNASYVKLPFTKKQYDVIHDGMRMSVTVGTAKPLLVDYVDIAGKTGTAELGVNREFKNSWSVGFWPYKNPRFAFAVVLEKGPEDAAWSASHSMKKVFDWIKENRPEYLQGKYPNILQNAN